MNSYNCDVIPNSFQNNMENSSTSSNPSFPWGFLGQFENANQVQKPHFLNEVTTSSCSSSSSRNVAPLGSPRAQLSPTSSFNGSDILLPHSLLLSDYQKQNSNHSSSEQTNGLKSFSQSSNRVGQEEDGFVSAVGAVSHQCEASSSFNSFVDALLEQDIEIKASFPELLDECFDF